MAKNLSFGELYKETKLRELQDSLKVESLTKEQYDEFERNRKIMSEMMSTKGSYSGPKINMEEALRAPDASILFPKVISDVLLRPKEPLMIGQTLLSKTVNIDNTRSVEFPVLGAIRAFDMSDTQEYREQAPGITEHLTEVKVNKVGVMVAIAEEVIKDSMWDVLALYLEAAGYAMLRHKEEKIFNEFLQKGHVVFDNSLTNPAAWTHGRNSAQQPNYSVTFDDFIDTMGAMVSQEYVPTDIVMHPLAWSVFAKDPILRNVLYTQGQIGQTIWKNLPDFDQQMNVPWSINYQVTPFVKLNLNATLTTGPASGLSATNITDIYVIDRQNACVVLQRDAMEVDHFDDPRRDIQMAKMRERYGVGTLNGGRATALIKNVRLETNWMPIQSYFTVAPS